MTSVLLSSVRALRAGDYLALVEDQTASIYLASGREPLRTLYTGADAANATLALLRGRPVLVAVSKQMLWARDALSGEVLWISRPGDRSDFPSDPAVIRWGDAPVISYTQVGKWGHSVRSLDLATGDEGRGAGEGVTGVWDADGWYAVHKSSSLLLCEGTGRALTRITTAPQDASAPVGEAVVDDQGFTVWNFSLSFNQPPRVFMTATEALVVSGPAVGCIDRNGKTLWATTRPDGNHVYAATRAPDGWRLLVAHGSGQRQIVRVGAGEYQALRDDRQGVAFVDGLLLRDDFSLVGIDDGAPHGALPEPALADVQTSAQRDESGEPVPTLMGARGRQAGAVLVERSSQPPAAPASAPAGLDLEALVAAGQGRWKLADETLPSGLRTLATGTHSIEWAEGQGGRRRNGYEEWLVRLGVLPDASLVLHLTRELHGRDYPRTTTTELIGPMLPAEAVSWVARGVV